jgi:hypothetical protein
MTMLILETPEAKAALARCVRLLLMWADEAEEEDAADANTVAGSASAAEGDDLDDRRRAYDTPDAEGPQTDAQPSSDD